MSQAAAPDAPTIPPLPLSMRSQDGLTLRGHYWRAHGGARRRPVLCLAGLTRNGRDFGVIARALSEGKDARDVYTLDMRGRGASDFDADWRNYAIPKEANDVIDFMTTYGLFDVGLIGTSRGGLLGLVLMALQPTRVGALVLNDIGPVIEREGLARIAGYVGRIPLPADWKDATAIVKRTSEREFTGLADAEWEAIARQWFNERNGRPVPGYDAAIARTFADSAAGIPELWPQFDATRNIPCLTLRGANSDLLSEATVTRMAQRHPRFTAHTVPNQGHAPLLRDTDTIAVVRRFLVDND